MLAKTKNFFVKTGNKLAAHFGSLHPLVMMQLKDKIDFSFLKDKKKMIFKIVWTVVGMAAVTAIIYLLFYLAVRFSLFSFLQILNFRVFLIVMTILLCLSFISCLANVTSTLYFAKDNPVLLTMPVRNSTIFISKIIVCFLYELIKNAVYFLPVLVAYGMIMKLPFTFYLWILFAIVFVTLIFVAIAGLLSIPAMFVAIAFKRYRFLELFAVIALAAGITYGIVVAILAIPTDIDLVRDWGKLYWQIQNFLASFAKNMFLFDYFVQFITGMSYTGFIFTPISVKNSITFGILVGIFAFCFVAVYFLSKPLFLKMASTPFEYKKKSIIKNKHNIKKPPFLSAIWQETKQISRTPDRLYSLIAIAIATPIAILLQNQIISAMDTRLTGQYMGISFNILIILLLILSGNVTIASLFSKEGNSAYLNKINPVSYWVPLLGKIVFQTVLFGLSIVASVCVMNSYSHIGTEKSALLGVALVLLHLGHVCWSAELDLMNPQNRLYQTSGKQQKNPNENKSTLIAFLTSALFAFLAYFFMKESFVNVFTKLIFIALAFFVIRLSLLLTKIKLYYGEK